MSNTENRQEIRTKSQTEVIEKLTAQFDLSGMDENRILFLNPRDPNEPWIPSDILEAIARQIENYQSSTVDFAQYIPELEQVIYSATVHDKAGRSFSRPGAASVYDKGQTGIDMNVLAQTRALSAALRAAGFNPIKSGSVIKLEDHRAKKLSEAEQTQFAETDAIAAEAKDRRQIHALAYEKGLIVNVGGGTKDVSEYRRFLQRTTGKNTSVGLSAMERIRVINALQNYLTEDELTEIDELEAKAA